MTLEKIANVKKMIARPAPVPELVKLARVNIINPVNRMPPKSKNNMD